jgi:archaemetzincin
MPENKTKYYDLDPISHRVTRNADTLRENIIISPIGEFDSNLIGLVGQEVHRIFGYRTQIEPLIQHVDFAFDSTRNQHCSTPIIEKLAAMAPPKAIKILGITRVDLFIPILTHVYGEAQLGGKACIISTLRLNEGLGMGVWEPFSRRVVKEAIHELGHTFNLRHCQSPTCCMHYCRSIKDVDRKSGQLCRYCKVLLEDEMKRLVEK